MSANAVQKSTFEFKSNLVLRAVIWAAPIALLYMFYRQAMFYVPVEWTGSTLGWILRFPMSPEGILRAFIPMMALSEHYSPTT